MTSWKLGPSAGAAVGWLVHELISATSSMPRRRVFFIGQGFCIFFDKDNERRGKKDRIFEENFVNL